MSPLPDGVLLFTTATFFVLFVLFVLAVVAGELLVTEDVELFALVVVLFPSAFALDFNVPKGDVGREDTGVVLLEVGVDLDVMDRFALLILLGWPRSGVFVADLLVVIVGVLLLVLTTKAVLLGPLAAVVLLLLRETVGVEVEEGVVVGVRVVVIDLLFCCC